MARMTKGELLQTLGDTEPTFPRLWCRLHPTSFDADDAQMRAFPRSVNWRWASAERALRLWRARTAVLRLPLFWQVVTPLHHACKAVGAAIFVNEPENIPVAGAAVRSTDAPAVFSTPRDAQLLAAYLAEKRLPPAHAWFLIYTPEEAWSLPDALSSAARVAQEVHLFPGVPILEQCSELIGEKSPFFHPADGYLWDNSGSRSRITSAGDDLVPLTGYELPFRLEHLPSACACGKLSVKKI